ncbi:hypothetical protein ATANTOWER_030989 [Ataeniobius toweri]|uniref:Uncharacterized protein n=1 Tax=Ataeniobius toweri TaxID=208326 RepID=A0ABU7BW60_9TELE|nr:hypothetical protein [Ataeniobius toweri]
MLIVHGFSPALHSSHSTSPEFASNLAMSASSSPLYRRPACSSAPPIGVHLANALPCLSLGEMHHSIFFPFLFQPSATFQAFSVSHFSFSLRQILCFHTFQRPT